MKATRIRKQKLKSPKSVPKVRAKPVKHIKLLELIKKLRVSKRVLWGIDMSVKHPGMTRFDSGNNTLTHYFIRTRDTETSVSSIVTDVRSPFFNWKQEWVCLELPPNLRSPQSALSHERTESTW